MIAFPNKSENSDNLFHLRKKLLPSVRHWRHTRPASVSRSISGTEDVAFVGHVCYVRLSVVLSIGFVPLLLCCYFLAMLIVTFPVLSLERREVIEE